jgi:hypothetical protein
VLQGKGDVGKIAGNIALGTAGSALGSGIAGASSVGLNHIGLQAAEAGKDFTQTSNLLNKQISGTLGELGSAALDPSVGDGKFFEKVAKKRALTGAGDLIGAVGDVKQARREEAAARMRAEAPPEIEAKLPPPEEEQAILKAADEGEAEGQAPAAKASSDDAAAPAETPWADAADTAGGWVGASANRQAENGAGPGELGGLKQLGDAFNVFTALFTDRKKISPKTLGKGATSLVGILAPMAADKILPGSGEFVGAMIDYGKDMLNSYLPDAADQLVGQGLGRILGLPSPGDDLPPARVPEPLDPNRTLPDLGPGPRSDVDEQLEKFQVGPKRRIEERPPEEPPGLGPLGPGPRSDVDEQLEKFQVGPKRRIAEEPAGEPARVRIAVTDEDERTRAAEIEDASEAEDQAPAEPTPVRPTSTNEEELAHEALEVMKRDLEIGDRRDFPKVDAEALGSATQKLAAKENLDPAETRALLDNAVAASRQLLVDENDRARPEHRVDDPFAPENLGGMCHPTQKSAARTLEDSGIDPENVVRRSINPGGEREHHFTVVTIGSETYLVDPTFAQFVQKQSPAGDVGREMIANGGPIWSRS